MLQIINKIYFYTDNNYYSPIQSIKMAQQFSANVYQFNSQDPVPLANVGKLGFPSAGVLLRVANDTSGNPGILLSSGVRCYGQIQLVSTGATYLTDVTQAALITAANT